MGQIARDLIFRPARLGNRRSLSFTDTMNRDRRNPGSLGPSLEPIPEGFGRIRLIAAVLCDQMELPRRKPVQFCRQLRTDLIDTLNSGLLAAVMYATVTDIAPIKCG